MGIEIQFEEQFKSAGKKVADHAEERITEAAYEVRNETLETLSGQRTGLVYRVPGSGATYTASAPGEPPARQLGDLVKSVKVAIEVDKGHVIGAVGTDLDKGAMLEFGTSKMEPRPWLRPSFEKSAAKVKEILTRVWF